MKSSIINTLALAGSLLAAGQAFAGPAFTFDPSGANVKAGSPSFVADQMNGLSSELITFGAGGSASATGYLPFDNFSLLGSTLKSGVTGLNNTYGLYLTFNLTDQANGTDANGKTTYILTSLNFTLYLDPKNDTTFNAPNATTGTGGTVSSTDNSDDFAIATGSLKSGTASIGSDGSVALNSAELITTVNTNYFTMPSPFYSIVLDAFNNTSGAYTQAGQFAAINGAGGNVSFAVPEPGSLALFGIAAVGLGLSARRRRKA